MIFQDFYRDLKIGFYEEKAQKFLTGTVKTIEAESLSGNFSPEFFSQVDVSLDAFLKYKDTYVQLKEKFKHKKKTQLEIAMDWHDLNKMLNDLFTHKATSEEIYLQTRANKIIKRFNTLFTQ